MFPSERLARMTEAAHENGCRVIVIDTDRGVYPDFVDCAIYLEHIVDVLVELYTEPVDEQPIFLGVVNHEPLNRTAAGTLLNGITFLRGRPGLSVYIETRG